jgi:hypothetical protein
MNKTKRLALGLILLAAPLATQAQLLDFDFSFQNAFGTVAGTVSGEILGLANNSTGAASEVLITSFPAGLGGNATPINATLWLNQSENSFTVVNGEVVAGGFFANNPGIEPEVFYLDAISGLGFNFLSLNDGPDYVYGDSGLAAANIVPAASAPDAASTVGLLGGVLAGLGVLRRKLAA